MIVGCDLRVALEFVNVVHAVVPAVVTAMCPCLTV